MVAYYGKLQSLWDDLENYEQALTYTYKGSTCDIQTKLEKRKRGTMPHVFYGLDDDMYGTVCSNLLATDPMPSLNKMYSILVQVERM
jgi:hypothetical protein